jgi:hypothetical protein
MILCCHVTIYPANYFKFPSCSPRYRFDGCSIVIREFFDAASMVLRCGFDGSSMRLRCFFDAASMFGRAFFLFSSCFVRLCFGNRPKEYEENTKETRPRHEQDTNKTRTRHEQTPKNNRSRIEAGSKNDQRSGQIRPNPAKRTRRFAMRIAGALHLAGNRCKFFEIL